MTRFSIRHTPLSRTINAARRFRRAEDGVALIEFAIVLPAMLLVFAVIIEGSRLMFAYQSAISGVRDATRYLSRVVPVDICTKGGSVTGHTTKLTSIVAQSVSGTPVFPPLVTINSVTPSLACVAGTYRNNPAPVATVTANFSISFPFSGVFALYGGNVTPLTKSVTDSARVFGT
ncbi:TadE/TadG family type IV pilus assembly protein [Defluviimonas sp. D31]|uniref:TadE/TadG family type IV pilus assembly protein n=1 Tax=Defluviimonas sp. D31 TaxID=3083253 RepID=UPI00296EE1D7|nr:TadE/TadG family type IV pilus assembly protein [Defluviimonas sp. D31]MDW4550593.1 TadE/TadG family type IV pilus assembly protein [Defluviimonas sp. D31]